MTPWADVVVAGGGIAGAAAARALARAGRRVVLVEPGPLEGAATNAAAGMLAAQVEARAGDALLPLALAGREAWRRLVSELPVEVLHRVGWRPIGIARIATDPAGAAALRGQCESQLSLGLAAEWLEGAELRRRWPGLGPAPVAALLAPDDGCVDNPALAAALRAAATISGAQIVTARVETILTRIGRVSAVRTSAGTWRTRRAVIAAGAWSPAIGGLPRALPIEPVRGQMIACAAPGGWARPVLFGPRGYIVPRGDRLLLGSTMEYAGFDHATTEAGLATITSGCVELVPFLAHAPRIEAWAGLRPITSDGLPILGRDPDVEGLIYATGHGRNGILLGPLTGELVRDLVVRGETDLDLAPYGPGRFGMGGTMAERSPAAAAAPPSRDVR